MKENHVKLTVWSGIGSGLTGLFVLLALTALFPAFAMAVEAPARQMQIRPQETPLRVAPVSPGLRQIAPSKPAYTQITSSVTGFKATVQGNSVTLSWNPVIGATEYVVRREKAGVVDAWLDSVKGTSVVDSRVANGNYQYAIYPQNPMGAFLNDMPVADVWVGQRRGKYRVTVNGFKVYHETWDHALEVDGKRDEVFVMANVNMVNKEGKQVLPVNEIVVRTDVMGDTNNQNGRIKAGSASLAGGIRTNDSVPTATPWIRATNPTTNNMPLNVWQGEIVEGENAVIVMPSIWEYDGGQDVFNAWTAAVASVTRKLNESEALRTALATAGPAVLAGFELAVLGVEVVAIISESGIVGQASDRPIGSLVESGKDAKGKPLYRYEPPVVLINYNTAEAILNNNIGGKGPGIIALAYKDPSALAGDYVLYLQVERLL